MLAGELTADVDRAALILKARPVTVRELAAYGALRGRKVGRCWVFVVADLLAYIQGAHDPRPAAEPQPWEARFTSSAAK